MAIDIGNKTVLVIGCGGLGCNVITHLTGAGIGRLFICDHDTVSLSNLNRQFLYRRGDIGKKKCLAACENLKDYNPETELIPVCKKIVKAADLGFAEEADLIVLAVDNNDARRVADAYCRRTGKALVCGGISGFYGMAYLFVPGRSAGLEETGLLQSENAGEQVSSTAGIIGSLEAELAIRYLMGEEDSAGKLMVYDEGTIVQLPVKAGE